MPRTKVDLTKYVESCRFSFDEVFDENADTAQVLILVYNVMSRCMLTLPSVSLSLCLTKANLHALHTDRLAVVRRTP